MLGVVVLRQLPVHSLEITVIDVRFSLLFSDLVAMPTCLIEACASGRSKNEDWSAVTWHAFPKSIHRIKQWLQPTGRFLDVHEAAEEILRAEEKYCLCSRHFTQDCYVVVGNQRRLKPDAVPSVFTRITEDLQDRASNYRKEKDGAPPPCSCQCTRPRKDAATQTEESWFGSGRDSLSSVHSVERHTFISAGQGGEEPGSGLNPSFFKETAESEEYQETTSMTQSFPTQIEAMKRRLKMEKDHSHLTEEIIKLALKIVYLLTGEDFIVVKKTSSKSPQVSEEWSRTPSPVEEPSARFSIHERNNDQKILAVTNKIIKLLTEEELEYIEGHKDLYDDMKMEHHRPVTLLDGPSNGNTPRRSPSPLYPQECLEKNVLKRRKKRPKTVASCINQGMVEDTHERERRLYEDEDKNNIKAEDIKREETWLEDGQQTPKEEIPIGGHISGTISKRQLDLSAGNVIEENAIVQDSSSKNLTTQAISLIPQKGDLSSTDPYDHMEHFFDASSIKTENLITDENITSVLCPGDLSSNPTANLKHSSDLSHTESTGHREGKRFLCQTCGKWFSHKSNLIVHQRIHTREKPFSCLECGKSFSHKSNLAQHRRLHTGQRPHMCSECGKCFIKKSDLLRHQKTHEMVKPFACSECGKCFTLKSNMLRHQQNHKGETPFICSVCGKCFSLKSNLGNKPFMCPDCHLGTTGCQPVF